LQNGTANTSVESFIGGSGNDTINGWGGNDQLSGGAGNDSLNGGDGADNLFGNAGADTLDGGVGNDYLYAGSSASDNSDLSANLLIGGNGNNSLYGSGGNDALLGGSGNDSLTGNAGNDVLSGSSLGLAYGGGVDTLYGGDGADTLYGGGSDYLYGGAGDDILYAGLVRTSTDTYYGSGDHLYGGDGDIIANGKDCFRFQTTAVFASQSTVNGDIFNAGHFIRDFTLLEDKIQFAASMTGDGDVLLENVAMKAASGGTFAKVAEMIIVQADLTSSFSSFSGGDYWTAINASEVVAVIGQANAAFTIGDKRLFVVDDGIGSALFQFVSADANATISAAELKLIGVVNGQASLTSSDFGLY
jgi:Ca2+-binding RTX toxin-like protein